MKKQSVMKDILDGYDNQEKLFLSLINEEGTIFCANDLMLKTLHLQNPETVQTNFFDLLHPVNLNDFKKTIHNCSINNGPFSVELFLKNGHYHPMKWEVSLLHEANGKGNTYLCAGHKLLDDERLEKFNRLGEKNYQLIVEGLNAGILFQDNKGEVIAANKKAAEIFNSTLERLYQLQDIEALWNSSWVITMSRDVAFYLMKLLL